MHFARKGKKWRGERREIDKERNKQPLHSRFPLRVIGIAAS